MRALTLQNGQRPAAAQWTVPVANGLLCAERQLLAASQLVRSAGPWKALPEFCTDCTESQNHQQSKDQGQGAGRAGNHGVKV
ncbi:MAG: hypothetical protein RLZZ216_1482 [Cyanobacteriota bacterium]